MSIYVRALALDKYIYKFHSKNMYNLALRWMGNFDAKNATGAAVLLLLPTLLRTHVRRRIAVWVVRELDTLSMGI